VIRKKILQAAAVLAAFSGAAQASTLDFQYTFADGQSLSGTMTGTLSGGLVTDISNVNITFDGNSYSGTLFSGTFNAATNSYSYGPSAAVISTTAGLNNFIFADSNDPAGLGVTNYFYFVNGTTPSGTGTEEVFANNTNTGDIDFDNPGNDGSWKLSVAPVPVPAAFPLMVSGLGLLAAARRRRQQADTARA